MDFHPTVPEGTGQGAEHQVWPQPQCRNRRADKCQVWRWESAHSSSTGKTKAFEDKQKNRKNPQLGKVKRKPSSELLQQPQQQPSVWLWPGNCHWAELPFTKVPDLVPGNGTQYEKCLHRKKNKGLIMHRQPDNNELSSAHSSEVRSLFPNYCNTNSKINPNQLSQLSGPAWLLDADFGQNPLAWRVFQFPSSVCRIHGSFKCYSNQEGNSL